MKLFEESGCQLGIIWECNWNKLSSDREIISFTQSLKSANLDTAYPFTRF